MLISQPCLHRCGRQEQMLGSTAARILIDINAIENIKVSLDGNVICLPCRYIYFAATNIKCRYIYFIYFILCVKIKNNRETTGFQLWSHYGSQKTLKSNVYCWVCIIRLWNHHTGMRNKSVHKQGPKRRNFSVGNLIGIVHWVDLHAWNSLRWSSGRAFPLLQQENKSLLSSGAWERKLTSPWNGSKLPEGTLL